VCVRGGRGADKATPVKSSHVSAFVSPVLIQMCVYGSWSIRQVALAAAGRHTSHSVRSKSRLQHAGWLT